MKKKQRQFNADLYLSSINIATKLPPTLNRTTLIMLKSIK